MHLWLASYGRVAIILALALAIGYPASRRIVRGPAAPVLALFAGLALLSLLVCLLSWLRIFDGLSIILIGVVGAVLSAIRLGRDAPAIRAALVRAPERPELVASLFVLVLVLLVLSMLALYPPTALVSDAIEYHLPLARNLVHHHGLVYDPFVRYSFFPQANEALFAVLQLLSSDPVSAGALEFTILAMVVLVMPLWFAGAGRRPAAGFLAGLLVLSSPVVIWTSTTAFVDTWALAFVAVALLVGIDAAQGRGSPAWLLGLCGAFLGEAAATKYSAALYGACALVAVAVAAGRSRLRPWWGLATLSGAAMFAVPWYAWTVHTTGDPVYPFATSVFGNRSGLWTSTEIGYQKMVARATSTPGVVAILKRDWQYLQGSYLYSTGIRSPVSWLLGLGPLALLARPARRDRALVGTALASLLCAGCSIFLSADPRYVVPALGVVALCGGLAADCALGVIAAVPDRRRRARRGGQAAFVAVAAAATLWPAASYAAYLRDQNGTPPATPAATRAYITSQTPCYPVVLWLNRTAGPHYRAWQDGCGDPRYYARGQLIGDLFSTGSILRVFDYGGTRMPDDVTFARRLAPLRVKWVILPVANLPSPVKLERHGLFALAIRIGQYYVFRFETPAGA